MSYSLRDEARSQAAARLARIRGSESSDKPAGSGVSEDYGVKAAGPSSTAKFKRGGAVHGDKPKARLDKAPRGKKKPHKSGGGEAGEGGGQGDNFGVTKPDEQKIWKPEHVEGPRVAGGTVVAELPDGVTRKTYDAPVGGFTLDPTRPKLPMKELTPAKAKTSLPVLEVVPELALKRGGKVSGKKPDAKPHRATGGAVKAGRGKTNVNIIIAPQGGGGGEKPVPVPVPVPAGGPMMPPPGAMPPPPPMAAGPAPDAFPNAPPSLPPAALAALAGGVPRPDMPMPMRKRGGRISMDAGAGSGEGRLEKVKEYGAKARR